MLFLQLILVSLCPLKKRCRLERLCTRRGAVTSSGGCGGATGSLILRPSSAAAPPPVESSLPPPPSPLPSFSPITPLQRSVTMPAVVSQVEKKKGKMKGIVIDESDIYEEEEEEEEEKGRFCRRKKEAVEVGLVTPTRAPNQMTPPEIKGMAWDYFFMDNMPQQPLDEVEDEEGGYMEERSDDHSGNINFNSIGGTVELKTPENQVGSEKIEEFKIPEETLVSVAMEKHFFHAKTAPPAINKVGFGVGEMVGNTNSVDLLKVCVTLMIISSRLLKVHRGCRRCWRPLDCIIIQILQRIEGTSTMLRESCKL